MTTVTVEVPEYCVERIREIASVMRRRAETPQVDRTILRKEMLIKAYEADEVEGEIPTMVQLLSYIFHARLENRIDAYAFFDSMQSMGWRVKGTPVRYWRRLIDWSIDHGKYPGKTDLEEQRPLPTSLIRSKE